MKDAATEKFAALLRELKQRSGRSYGSLAARLHVSTSTLHRYCNGDAVPSSYAPAERFARLCGATPDELVELHRRWHRAHGTRRGSTPSWAAGEGTGGRPSGARPGDRGSGAAARGGAAADGAAGRGRGPGAARGGVPAADDVPGGATGHGREATGTAADDAPGGASGDVNDATATAPSAPGGTQGRSSATAATDDATSAATAATSTPQPSEPGSPGGSGVAAGRAADVNEVPAAARSGQDGLQGLGPATVAADDVTREATAAAPAARGGSPAADGRPARGRRWVQGVLGGRRGRWRRVGVPGVGVAAAALVAFVATSNGSTGEGRADGGPGPASGVVADGSRGGGGAQGGETVEKERSAEPSERRKPAPTGGDGGGGADGDATPGATPRKDGAAAGGRDTPAVQTPLAWSVRSHVWSNGCDHRYVIDKSPDDVPPPPMAQDAEAWASSQGAVHGGTTNIEAALEPRGDEPVTVTAVHVRKTATGTPLPWAAFAMSSGCGGEVTQAAYTVDLDKPRPVLKPKQGGDSTQKWDPPALPFRVTDDDPLSLLIHAGTEDYDVRWYLEVEWSSGDDSGVVRLDDQGAPFRTSAITGRPLFTYDTLNGSWYTEPVDAPADESASAAP
ncbi:helix-turn-helix transcriptional regulator [Streptomyces sp. B5E4]|uniref:helix-turn-helix domain-containing protein n=1 Tax=Streptomyces sp. B5E4 TaxID=3153568 RepID=UPI00325D6989